jgi:hypothetical protein
MFFNRFTYAPNVFHRAAKEEERMMIAQNSSTAAEEKLHHTKHCNEKPAMSATEGKPRMVRLTVNLPSDLAEQMRDAVYWTPGLTLA